MRFRRGLALMTFLAAVLVAGATQAATTTTTPVPRKLTHHQGPRARGIDVSEWESPVKGRQSVDFGAVRNAGYTFAITRVSYGAHYMDGAFDSYFPAIRKHHLVRGVYQFFLPDQDSIEQANVFCNKVKKIKTGDLPPILDVEVPGPNMGSSIPKWSILVRARLGVKPLIYTAPGLWDGFGVTLPKGHDHLWVADYGPSRPAMPNGWRSWVMWQFTDHQNVPGVGPCDANVFNGTVEDLKSYVGLAPNQPIP
ncbi:MAG TPA: GH25 family lysozyme [Planctomycetota bacterium]|nr:GH25 family lysozyme [Planctomycetota bacterium]